MIYYQGLKLLPNILKSANGLNCTVLGSAPNRRLPENYVDSFIVCVNGSGLGLSRSPDLTVMGAQICLCKTRTCRHTIRNINGRFSERMLWVHPGNMTDYEDRYRDFGFSWSNSETLIAEDRWYLVKQLTGYELPGLAGNDAPSNGALAALMIAATGADKIFLAGFSFATGHFYIDTETPRNHINHDEVIFDWLAKHSLVYSTDIDMHKRFGFSLA